MSYEKVKQYFEKIGLEGRLKLLEHASGTVEQAAEAIGCEPQQIAKTLSFLVDEKPVLIIAAGDARVDNKKFKALFHQKAKMIPADQVESYVGHAPGGVCPFATREGVSVYLDTSLKRFAHVYPAGGNDHSAVDLSLEELEKHSHSSGWIDVCKDWNAEG